MARLLTENLRPTGHVEPKALERLVPVLADFGIQWPGDLVLLSRTLVTLDETLGVISPGISIAAAASDLASTTSPATFDPKSMLQDELLGAIPRLRKLPDRVDRIMTLAARGDLRMRSVIDEDHNRILRTLINRGLLAAIGSAFLLVAAILLAAAESGPALAPGTGLFEIFGYGGLIAVRCSCCEW